MAAHLANFKHAKPFVLSLSKDGRSSVSWFDQAHYERLNLKLSS
jgi:hypothetical protein